MDVHLQGLARRQETVQQQVASEFLVDESLTSPQGMTFDLVDDFMDRLEEMRIAL